MIFIDIIPWYVWALAAAVIVATSSIAEKHILTKEHATRFTASLAIMSALVSLPVLPFIGWSDLGFEVMLWIYLASVLGSIAFLFVARAIKNIDLGEVSIFLLASPAVVAVLSYLILGELLTRKEVVGLLLALGGVCILEWPSFRSFLRTALAPSKLPYLLFAIGAVFYIVFPH